MVGSLADDDLVLSDDQDHDTPESAATTEMYNFFIEIIVTQFMIVTLYLIGLQI